MPKQMGVNGLAGPKRSTFGVAVVRALIICLSLKDLGLRKLQFFSWTQGGTITANPHAEDEGIEHFPVKLT